MPKLMANEMPKPGADVAIERDCFSSDEGIFTAEWRIMKRRGAKDIENKGQDAINDEANKLARALGVVTFSYENSEIWEHVSRFPKISEAFLIFRKSRNNLLGGFLRRMITALFSEK